MEEHSVPFYIADSPLGFGVFASHEIRKGAHIYKFTGAPVTFQQSASSGKEESYSLQVGEQSYIQLDPPGKFINHSCEPNCGVTPELELIALADIVPHEELRFDYSTTMLERHWVMACKCHTDNCRYIIRDFDFLPWHLQKSYIRKGIVQPFILDLLRKKTGSSPKSHDNSQQGDSLSPPI